MSTKAEHSGVFGDGTKRIRKMESLTELDDAPTLSTLPRCPTCKGADVHYFRELAYWLCYQCDKAFLRAV